MNSQPIRYSAGALGFANDQVDDQATTVLYILDPNDLRTVSGD